jgi:hypothetical protein
MNSETLLHEFVLHLITRAFTYIWKIVYTYVQDLVIYSVYRKYTCIFIVRGATQKFPKFECRSLTT